MANSDTRKDKRVKWGIEVSITKQLISGDLRSVVLMPFPDSAEDVDFNLFDADKREFLNEIYCEFGQYSAWKLRAMTHGEPPWKDARKEDLSGVEISHESLINYFSQFVEEVDDE